MDQLGKLPTIFARKCTVRRIEKSAAAAFLSIHHRMGWAAARYCYGAFRDDELVAVATFSGGRRMRDGSRSFEWIRYASQSGMRLVGGMGKLLDAFVEEVGPDDVMTYVDASISDGGAYRELGFEVEGKVEGEGYTNFKLRKRFSTVS